MERMKRVVSLLLCFVMVFGLLPMGVLATENTEDSGLGMISALNKAQTLQASGDVIDAAIFCSDLHGNTSSFATVFTAAKSNDSTFNPSTASFVGDTDADTSTVTTNAQKVFTGVECIFAYGSHDSGKVSDFTGVSYGAKHDKNYYIYTISQSDMEDSSPDTSGFTSDVASMDKTKPLFILSHMPLHARRGDNYGASAWYKAISAAADQMDIVFFWAHNHTGESNVDTNAYYVAKDGNETMSIQGGSTVTPNFTYMNAGYIDANGQSPERKPVATTVKIYADSLVFQDYTTSGAYTNSSYSHNVEVAREFASSTGGSGSTDTTDPTEGGEEGGSSSGTTTDTKEVYVLVDTMTVGKDYLIANGNNGTVTLLGQSSGSQTTTTANVVTEGDYTYIETADAGYVWNATAHPDSSYSSYPRLINAGTYAMYANKNSLAFSSDLSSESGAIYTRYWTYTGGVLACVSTNSGSTTYYMNSSFALTSSSTTGVYLYEKRTIETEVEVTLSSIAVSGPTTTVYNVGDTFSSDGLVVTATYSDGSTKTVTPTSVSTPDMTTAGTKTVTVTYTEGDVTKTATFDITVNDVISDNATVTGIEVTGAKTEYTLGETLSTAGMVVTATYDDNGTTKTADVTDYTVSEVDMTTEGEKTVTVSYTFNGTTVTDTFTITVTEAQSNEITLGGSAPVDTTVYVLTDTLTSGKNYLIVDANAAGSGNAATNSSSSSVTNTAVTIVNGSLTVDGTTSTETYIVLGDDDSAAVWTSGTTSSSYTFKNGSYYLYHDSGEVMVATSGSKTNWSWGTNALYYTGGKTTYYLTYDSGWTLSSSSANVYLYEETTASVVTDTTVTYTMRAEDLKQVVDTTNTATLAGEIDFCLQGNGSDLTSLPSGGSYSFTVLSDEKDIIFNDAIANDGTFTFTGNTGTAKVKVAYTWTADGNTYTVYKNITVEATEPYFTLDLHKANITYTAVTGEFDPNATYFIQKDDGTYEKVEITEFASDVTYYTVSATVGDEITSTIPIKGIEEGDRYGVWAVITGYDGVLDSDGNDGASVGDVADGAIKWSSSDESVATVDPTTGIITFTGKEGTVQITADYAYGTEGKVATDTITISATASNYSLPADGTSDFPEYPNEGSIRYDKTAEAVGNFSETGIAQVELSMTGVPYTTGSEIDVVLMLDMTGSMTTESMAAAEAAALAFARQIILNQDGSYNNNRISIQVFNKNGVTELWAMSAVTKDTYSSLVTAIESASTKQDGGGTPYSTALSGCKDILDAARKDGVGNNRQQFCVFVSDGTPTSMTMISNYDAVKAGTATTYTTTTSSTYYGTYPEYYSTLMKDDGVTVYGVYTSAAAGSSGSGSGGGSVNDTEEGTAIMQTVASSDDKVYTIDDYTDTSALTGVFTSIAKDIMQAATDVTVEDQIAKEYTMIFDIPTGTESITGVTNDFYIEFVKYPLDATTHERVDANSDGAIDYTSVTKLYLKNTNGVYSAAKDASGTAYDAPVFANATLGDKGTLYYWTTDTNFADEAALSYSDGTNTYYFIPYGIKATDHDYDSTKWFNMTSGAYAYGTVDSTTNMSTDLVIATPYFVYDAASRMLYWTVEKLENATTEYALRYFLYLDDSATEIGTDDEADPGPYPTNHHAYITYTNFNGNDCRQIFPVPQLTWNGAQVSYVFYLVNSNGEPINKSGQVVDFANATFITDVFTEHVVWNDSETPETADGFAYLDATYKAQELLPVEYSLFDTSAYYELYVYEDAEGNTLDNYFKITGSEANGSTSSTTKVYITKAGTKYSAYGTYTDANVYTGFDFGNTTVAFAVVWQPRLVPDTVVVDYGLDVLINVVQNDLMQNTISGIGLGKDAYGTTAMNTGVATESKLGTAALTTSDGSTISIENENQIRFHQNNMMFKESVTFYYESPVAFYEGSDKQTGYMYSSVTVIPATTIYYEDDFLELEGNWVVTAADSATQAQDRPGASQISKELDADNNYGYDGAYTDYAEHSLNGAAMAHVNADSFATASFSFYGTGFDVIGLTSNTTGVLWVKVTNSTTGEQVKSAVVNTYYGYTKNDEGEWVVTNDVANSLYQVPVMQIEELAYGKYDVVITASYVESLDKTSADGYDLYLDAIRVYNPAGTQYGTDDSTDGVTDNLIDSTTQDAYKADGEAWPTYIELRNNIIEASNYTETENEDGTVTVTGTDLTGAIFIDGVAANTSIADYVSYGPNNELYLAAGQSVAFTLTDLTNVADVQIGLKVASGGSVVYKVYNGNTTTVENAAKKTLTTTTDMYYSIMDVASGTIVITNASAEGNTAILSITNIKITHKEDPNSAGTAGLGIDDESATIALNSLRCVPDIEEEIPEVTEPETTEPEETTPETSVPEETEPEVTEPEETEPEETEPEETKPEEDTDSDVRKNMIKIIKKLLGWFFG